MIAPFTIDGRDIERWAERPDARRWLPRLVRRLLWASTQLRELEMPNDVDQSGPDGRCVAEKGSSFCPSGTSIWELSVEKGVKGKLDGDFTKRTGEFGAGAQTLAYVAVTARRHLRKQAWVELRRAERGWRDVRVIDADDLAQWLELCPSVAAWFAAEQLGRPVRDFVPVQEFLARWSTWTRPPLPASLVLAGRRAQVSQIDAWLAQQPGELHVRAATREEARVFVAAALTAVKSAAEPSGPDEVADRWLARAVVVETAEAWRWLIQQATRPLVLIPNFAEVRGLERRGHYVCVPVDSEGPFPRYASIDVTEPLPWREVAQVLQRGEIDEARALQVARESRGNLGALRRLLGLPELPAWSLGEDQAALTAMLLLGAWNPRAQADQEVVRALGVEPAALDDLCTRLQSAAERPMAVNGGAHGWASAQGAWTALHPLLSETRLRIFQEVAVRVLGEDDPMYDLPADQRYAAALYGKTRAHSAALREGIATSLLFLTHENDTLRSRIGSSIARRIVDGVVDGVLSLGWRRWASLDRMLQVIAEAAPQRFLGRLWGSLHAEDGVLRLFDEESHPGYAGTTPHVPLLWALEVLAWDPRTLPAAAEALALLADRDSANGRGRGRVANRPLESLVKIFQLVAPQTLEADARRFEILDELATRYPAVGFAVARRLTEQRRGGVLEESCKPRLDARVPVSIELPDDEGVVERMDRVQRLLLRAADHDAERWAQLLAAGIDRVLDEREADEFVAALIERRPQIDDPTARIWSAARRELGELYAFHRDLSDELVQHRDRLLQIFASFTPDRTVQVRRLFESEDLPEPHDVDDEPATRARLQELRGAALEELLVRDDAAAVFAALVAELGDVKRLGRALAHCSRAGEYVAKLLDQAPEEPWGRLVAPFAAGLFHVKGEDHAWFRGLLAGWTGAGRVHDVVATLLELWADPRIWDIVDALGEPVRSRYWGSVQRVGQHDEAQWERACENLLGADNRAVAFEVAATRAPGISTETLMAVLERLTAEDCARINSVGYWLGKLFAELDRRVEAPEPPRELVRAVVRLEIRFVDLLGHSRRPPRYLGVFTEPIFFVDSLGLVYRRPEDPEAIDPERVRLAGNVHSVLSAWRGFPGDDTTDAETRESRLRGWAEQVLALAHERGLGVGAQHEVANVLARPAAADDGHWPCMAARELLQMGAYGDLASYLQMARRNMRGMTARSLTEGGAQERGLAAGFHRSAEALRARWPQTAHMLEGLAASYEEEAERYDEQARTRRVASGYGPDPDHTVGAEPTAAEEPTAGARAPVLTRLVNLEVQGVGPAPVIALDAAPRLNLIAGDNSLGKTFLLDVVWWCLTGTWPEVEVETTARERGRLRRIAIPATDSRDARIRVRDDDGVQASAGYHWSDEEWKRQGPWPRTNCPVIYARVDGGYSAWDPLRNDLALPAYHFSEHSLWNGLLGPNDVPFCNGLITDWFNWSQDDAPLFAALRRVLEQLAPGGNEVEPGSLQRLRKHDARKMPSLKFKYGEVPFEHLSAGWRRILGLAYLLVWVWHEHQESARMQGVPAARSVVVLIDEAETHLHPRWQRKLLPALFAAIQALPDGPAVQLIATTHSPMIAASIETMFDQEQDAVFHLQLTDAGKVSIELFEWAKFGDASGWLESPLFGLERAMSVEAEQAIDAAYAFIRGMTDELPQGLRTREQIDAAMRRSVAETNPFWLRWTIFNDAGGNA